MTIGQAFALVGHIGDSLKKNGAIDAAGNLVKHPALMEASELAAVAGDVEAELKTDGVAIPAQLDKAIKIAPEVLGLVAGIAS